MTYFLTMPYLDQLAVICSVVIGTMSGVALISLLVEAIWRQIRR